MKESKISLSDWYNYMKNNLSKERMKEVADSIKKNGEVEMLFHSLMFDNMYNKAYVDSCIGPDDQLLDKNLLEDCQNFAAVALNHNQTKNTNIKNEEIMTTLEGMNVTENVGKVQKAVKALRPDIEEMMAAGAEDCKAYAQKRLVEHFDITDETAKKIVDELLEGIRMFDEQFDALKKGDLRLERINEVLKEKAEDEKKNLMVQSLAALEVLKNGEEEDEVALQKVQATYEQMSYEELTAVFERMIKEGDCFDSIVDSMIASRQPLDAEQIEALRELLEKHGEAYKLYVALALYMGHCDQKINLSVDENELDPKTVGVSAAAAIAIAEGPGEDADEMTWRTWMKLIFGALYFTLMLVVSCTLVTFTGITIVVGLMMLFGQGIISALIALGASVLASISLSNKLAEFMSWSLDALEEPYDWVVEYLVVRFHKLKEWLVEKRNQIKKEPAQETKAQEMNNEVIAEHTDHTEDQLDWSEENGLVTQ